MKYSNHYNIGVTTVKHKGKTIVTSLNSIQFESNINSIYQRNFKSGKIPTGYDHRPDLISNLFYSTVTNDWIILAFNNIKDPLQELNPGDTILIPN